jgi:hypothetical protein
VLEHIKGGNCGEHILLVWGDIFSVGALRTGNQCRYCFGIEQYSHWCFVVHSSSTHSIEC